VLGDDPHVDVDPARAGRLREADEAVVVEHRLDAQRDLAHVVPGGVGGRVEVDAQLVRAVEVGAADRPPVEVDHAEVDGPHEVGGVGRRQLARRAAGGERDDGGLEPLRRGVGHALLEERLSVGPVDVALEHRGPLAQVDQRRLGHDEVVLDEVALRVPGLREEQLAGIRQSHLMPGDLDRRLLARHRVQKVRRRGDAPPGLRGGLQRLVATRQ